LQVEDWPNPLLPGPRLSKSNLLVVDCLDLYLLIRALSGLRQEQQWSLDRCRATCPGTGEKKVGIEAGRGTKQSRYTVAHVKKTLLGMNRREVSRITGNVDSSHCSTFYVTSPCTFQMDQIPWTI
ncbi:hypothetical protein Bbelb_447030, partial [Branchiostoma belcheri]